MGNRCVLQALLVGRLLLDRVCSDTTREIRRLPFSEICGKQSVCTNIEDDALAEYCRATDGTRSGTNNLRVQKLQKTRAEMNFELRYFDSNVKVFFVRSVMNCGSC